MRLFIAALFSLIIAATPYSFAIADAFWINVSPTNIHGFTVDLEIETNVPGAITLAARLVYLDTDPDDPTFIGTGYIHFPVASGKGKVTIDAKASAMPRGYKLPNGNYEAEVVYNHLWPVNTKATKRIKVTSNFRGKAGMVLSSGNGDKSVEKDSIDNTQWVMENVFPGVLWDQSFWERKFGELEKVEYRGADDPKTRGMYYVKSINMTLLIDETQSTILAYRLGLAYE